MGRKSIEILIFICYTWLCACVKDKPVPAIPQTGKSGNVYIVCEGNFGNGDGTLYAYNTATNSVFGDLYKAANITPMGDVFQSMRRIGDSLYLCVNNSDKVVVINATTHAKAGEINIPKPRYILPISPDRVYISTLYSNKVYIVNPKTLKITGTITLPHNNPEGMCLTPYHVVICPWDTTCNKVYKTDAATGQITHAITVAGYAPHSILADKEQMLWVLSGNVPKGRTATLTRIDPSTGNILKNYNFATGKDPIKPVFNNSRDTLYFIQVKYDGSNDNNGIYRMSIHDAVLPTQPFVQAAKYQYFWALGIDPATGNIYTGDPKGFIQKGTVSIYTPGGVLQHTFDVGVGPGQFYFGE